MTIPYTFAGATTAIPLANLDANFASPITLGNVAMTLSNTYTSIGNLTLTNTTISSGNATVTNANVTTLTTTNDASISGLTVGKGGGSVSTNTVVGNGSLGISNTGDHNTVFGYAVLTNNTTGNFQTALGYGVLNNNTTGTTNTGVGYYSLLNNTSGVSNTAIGNQSLQSNTTASNITAVGYQAGYSNTTGIESVYLGARAGYSNTVAQGNVIIGRDAGYNTTGGFNTFAGFGSGNAITTGTKNTILGSYSGNQGGLDIRTASNNIVLSDGDGNPRAFYKSLGSNYAWVFTQNASPVVLAASECVQIDATSSGYGLFINTNSGGGNPIRFWSSTQQAGSITTTANTTNYGSGSDYRLKNDVSPLTGALDKVAKLKPVSWKWKADNSAGEGFIAHELAEVCPQAVYGEKDAMYEDGTINPQQVDTSFLVATLVAAIQELKAEVDSLKQQLGK